jgi:hypothetical protein
MRCGGKGDAIPLLQFFKMPRPVGGVIHFSHFSDLLNILSVINTIEQRLSPIFH